MSTLPVEYVQTPVERARERSRRRRWLLALFGVLVLGILLWSQLLLAVPVDYRDVNQHFKYGSIGSDLDNGLPYWVWRVMPAMCREQLAARGDGSASDYRSFGFITEPGYDRPIGFSKRRSQGIELVGLNCATCHVGRVRASPQAAPETVLTMPAHQLDLLAYFEFLSDCASDPSFTVDTVMAHIDRVTQLSATERLIYRMAIPRVREGLLAQSGRLSPLRSQHFRSGKGRIDTFNPYKALVLNYPEMELASPGASDLPSIWNQGVRSAMHLHWDGNNASLFERNLSAAIGAGVTPNSADLPRIERIAAWLQQVPPPKNPLRSELHTEAEAAGRALYLSHCDSCHGTPEAQWKGKRTGQVVPISQLGTDPARLDSHTYAFSANQWTIGHGHSWRFRHFRKTNGYASMPLDGVWARGPFLHNGSVPTLRDLLARPASAEAAAQTHASALEGGPSEVAANVANSIREARARGERPVLFYRGDDVLDGQNVGFVVARANDGARRHTLFDTTQEGCRNGGHLYGTELSASQKEQLLAYLKTL